MSEPEVTQMLSGYRAALQLPWHQPAIACPFATTELGHPVTILVEERENLKMYDYGKYYIKLEPIDRSKSVSASSEDELFSIATQANEGKLTDVECIRLSGTVGLGRAAPMPLQAGEYADLHEMAFESRLSNQPGCVEFAQAIANGKFPNLKSLNAFGSFLTSRPLGKILDAFESAQLMELELKGSWIGDEGVKTIASAAESDKLMRLEFLSLGERIADKTQIVNLKPPPEDHDSKVTKKTPPPITDAGFNHLARCVLFQEALPWLETLDIAGTKIGCGSFANLVNARYGGRLAELTHLSVNETLLDREFFDWLLELVWDEFLPMRGKCFCINLGGQLEKPQLKKFVLSCVEKLRLLEQDGTFSTVHIKSAWFDQTIPEFRDQFRTLRQEGNEKSDSALYDLVMGESIPMLPEEEEECCWSDDHDDVTSTVPPNQSLEFELKYGGFYACRGVGSDSWVVLRIFDLTTTIYCHCAMYEEHFDSVPDLESVLKLLPSFFYMPIATEQLLFYSELILIGHATPTKRDLSGLAEFMEVLGASDQQRDENLQETIQLGQLPTKRVRLFLEDNVLKLEEIPSS